MAIWFISDLHLGHVNVLSHCNRPFSSIDEMNRSLTNNWNDKVKEKDHIYVLGDLALTSRADKVLHDYLSNLNGIIHLIKGNHDAWYKKRPGEGSRLIYHDSYYELKDNNQLYVLCHYPFQTWNKSHHGSIHLHGHCHGTLGKITGTRRMDVGVDCHDYAPISIEEVNELLP